MNLSKAKDLGCEAYITGKRIVVFDELEVGIAKNGVPIDRINIKELPDLIKKLEMAKAEVLENYKSLSLTEKINYSKRNEIPYKDMQKLVTLLEAER